MRVCSYQGLWVLLDFRFSTCGNDLQPKLYTLLASNCALELGCWVHGSGLSNPLALVVNLPTAPLAEIIENQIEK